MPARALSHTKPVVGKASGSTNPKDADFDPKTAAQNYLGGRVFDPDGKPARNVLVRIELVGAPREAADKGVFLGVYTNNEGYFSNSSLQPGKTYDLIAEATAKDGKALTGVVQTKVPNPTLTIVLRDDLPATAGGLPPSKGPGDTFPPAPKPNDTAGLPAAPRPPADGAWAPGGSVTGVPPAAIGGAGAPKPPAGGGTLPQPDDISFPPPGAPPTKPENVADGPKDKFKPPAVNIPGPGGPPVPPLPTLPPNFGPGGGGGRSAMGTTTGGAAGRLALVDTLDRPWNLDMVKPGTLVLVEFMTSTCIPCKKSIPVLKDLQARYGAGGLQLVGVLCDLQPHQERVATAARYGQDNNLNYALYVEPGAAGSVRDQFDVKSYPTAVLLDSTGRTLWKGHPHNDRGPLEAAIKQHLGR